MGQRANQGMPEADKSAMVPLPIRIPISAADEDVNLTRVAETASGDQEAEHFRKLAQFSNVFGDGGVPCLLL